MTEHGCKDLSEHPGSQARMDLLGEITTDVEVNTCDQVWFATCTENDDHPTQIRCILKDKKDLFLGIYSGTFQFHFDSDLSDDPS